MGIYVTDASGNRKKVAGIGKIKEIPDGSITGDKLADDTITTSKLIDDSVTWSKLAANARPIRDNLLDNWHFVNPIDQRGGWMVKPGSPYLIPGTNTEAGTTTTYITVTGWAGTIGASNCYIKIDGTKYVTNRMYAVRGYCDMGGVIDRWVSASINVIIQTDCISLFKKDSSRYRYLNGRLPSYIVKELRGKTVTLSIFCRSTSILTARLSLYSPTTSTLPGEVIFNPTSDYGVYSGTITIPSDVETLWFMIYPDYTEGQHGELDVVAAKLELGPNQTLAHQDENGNWVLNEISDYDAELDKCQHYLFDPILDGEAYAVVGSVYNYSSTNKYVEFVIDLPNMRTIPTVIMDGSFQLLSGSNVYPVTNMHLSGSQNSRSKILLTVDTESVLPAGAYRLRRDGNVSSKLLFNSEL